MNRLYELCGTRENKDWVEFTNGTHNDTCMQSGYFSAIREFLETRVMDVHSFDHKEELDSPHRGAGLHRQEGYQLVSGRDNDIRMAQSFSIEEVELDE